MPRNLFTEEKNVTRKLIFELLHLDQKILKLINVQ